MSEDRYKMALEAIATMHIHEASHMRVDRLMKKIAEQALKDSSKIYPTKLDSDPNEEKYTKEYWTNIGKVVEELK
jgi:hypothetical protein